MPHALLASLAFLVYANSLSGGFITDDQFQILGNPLVTGGRSLFTAFGSGVWAFIGYRGNYYRPLQFIVYGLIYRAFGLNPFPFHLLMSLLHATNTALVYSLARRVLPAKPAAAAWIGAALFAAHPIHTEPVNWIAALPDVMVTALALSGLCAFAAEDAAPDAWQSAMHCAIYLAALLSKETGVVLPVLYVGYQWLRKVRVNRAMYVGMSAVLLAYFAMRLHALGGFAPAQQAFFHLTAAQLVMSAVVLLARYFAALVWPFGLNFFHVFHPTTGLSWQLLVSFAVLAAIAFAAARWSERDRPALFALFWIAASLAPTLNLGGVGPNVFTERYLYLPSVGFAVLAALAWAWLARGRPNWATPVAGAVLLAFAAATISRNRDWKDDFTLLQITLRQSPGAGYLHNLMAGAWVQRDQFQRALEEQELAVKYDPRSAIYRKNLGNILVGVDPVAAAREFREAIVLGLDTAELHQDLALAYRAMGYAAKASEEEARAKSRK